MNPYGSSNSIIPSERGEEEPQVRTYARRHNSFAARQSANVANAECEAAGNDMTP